MILIIRYAMKKIKILKIARAFVIVMIAIVFCLTYRLYFKKMSYDNSLANTEKNRLETAYAKQHLAFYFYQNGEIYYTKYSDGTENIWYHVDEPRLFVSLHVYSKAYLENGEELTLSNIEEFLENEYNEDGDLNVLYPPDRIADYIDYYWNKGGQQLGELAWNNIWKAKEELEKEYNISIVYPHDMTFEQLSEMCNYVDDPNYPINLEVIENE